MTMSYSEYLLETNQRDTRQNWITWKIEICGMEPSAATKVAHDSEWGYRKLEG